MISLWLLCAFWAFLNFAVAFFLHKKQRNLDLILVLLLALSMFSFLAGASVTAKI